MSCGLILIQRVRRTILHALADGSHRELAPRVVEAITCIRDDADPKLRKAARRVIEHHRRTGNVNIL